MGVLIENQQKEMMIREDILTLIERVVNLSLQQENFEVPCEVSITLVNNESIRLINKEHRGLDKPTDVLSFPILEFIDGKMVNNIGDFDYQSNLLLLGDILLSMEMVSYQALEYGHSVEREIAFLVSHGVFHLLGYDHLEEVAEKIMFEKQEAVLKKMGLER